MLATNVWKKQNMVKSSINEVQAVNKKTCRLTDIFCTTIWNLENHQVATVKASLSSPLVESSQTGSSPPAAIQGCQISLATLLSATSQDLIKCNRQPDSVWAGLARSSEMGSHSRAELLHSTWHIQHWQQVCGLWGGHSYKEKQNHKHIFNNIYVCSSYMAILNEHLTARD